MTNRANLKTSLVVSVLLLGAHCAIAAGNVIYVDDDASGANDGNSWVDAYNQLQDGLDGAGSGDEVWVGEGAYYPTTKVGGTDERNRTFQMKNGVAIYGGFPSAGDPNLNDRDPNTYETILTGDIGSPGDSNDNCYHVFYHPTATEPNAILDGFTIAAGNADGAGDHYYGGGMFNQFSSPTIISCTFSGNSAGYGGGMDNYSGSPTITNCTFSGNSATEYGGGIDNYSSNPEVTNCTFSGNSADYYGGGICSEDCEPNITNCTFSGNSAIEYGGGICNLDNGNPTITNCSFSGNSADYYGGGMFSYNGNPTVINCTFSGNSAGYYGGGIGNENSYPTLRNCILWGNIALSDEQIYDDPTSSTSVTYSDVQDSNAWGNGNIDSDPCFVDANGADNIFGTEDDNLRLQQSSPCIDAAGNSYVPGGVVTDINGNPRFIEAPGTSDTGNGTPPIVDMGAYECWPVIFVDSNAAGINSGSSWVDAFTHLADALEISTAGRKVWVAKGIYKPDSGNAVTLGDRLAAFKLINGVSMIGGYAGASEQYPNTRNIELYETILSGDLDGNDINVSEPCDLLLEPTRGENSYHVVTACQTDVNAVLDGFTIIGGNANGISQPNYCGAGIYNENTTQNSNCTTAGPTIKNCKIIENSAAGEGGGMYNRYSCQPQIINCSFIKNVALWGGGGIKNDTSNPEITNCSFENNFAGDSNNADGGAIDNEESSPVLTKCAFIGNSAKYGGAIGNWMGGCSPTFFNCVFSGNSAEYGGAMWTSNNYEIESGTYPEFINCTFGGNSAIYGNALAFTQGDFGLIPSNVYLTNCILWNGGAEIWNDDGSIITINYSDVQGGWTGPGGNNINDDPNFAEPNGTDGIAGTLDDNLRLLSGSPCIDAGINIIASYSDIDAFPRFIDDICTIDTGSGTVPIIDIGAHEFLRSDINSSGFVNLYDFAILAEYWMESQCGTCGGSELNCDGNIDLDDLRQLAAYWLVGK